MSIQSWLNRKAAKARLHELQERAQKLEGERSLLLAALSFARGEAPSLDAPAGSSGGSAVGAGARRSRPARGARPGESMTVLLAKVMQGGPSDKGWTIGELVDVLRKTHPERVRASNASSLVSAALAQALRAKSSQFVSRKRRGKRAHLYRLRG